MQSVWFITAYDKNRIRHLIEVETLGDLSVHNKPAVDLKLIDGSRVERLERGHYRVCDSGELLRSYEPLAP